MDDYPVGEYPPRAPRGRWKYFVEEVKHEDLTRESLQNLLNKPDANYGLMDLMAAVEGRDGGHLLIFRY